METQESQTISEFESDDSACFDRMEDSKGEFVSLPTNLLDCPHYIRQEVTKR